MRICCCYGNLGDDFLNHSIDIFCKYSTIFLLIYMSSVFFTEKAYFQIKFPCKTEFIFISLVLSPRMFPKIQTVAFSFYFFRLWKQWISHSIFFTQNKKNRLKLTGIRCPTPPKKTVIISACICSDPDNHSVMPCKPCQRWRVQWYYRKIIHAQINSNSSFLLTTPAFF